MIEGYMSDLHPHVPDLRHQKLDEQPRPSRKALWIAMPLLVIFLLAIVAFGPLPLSSFVRF